MLYESHILGQSHLERRMGKALDGLKTGAMGHNSFGGVLTALTSSVLYMDIATPGPLKS